MIPITFINYRPAEKFCYIREYDEKSNITYDRIIIGEFKDKKNKIFFVPVKHNICLAYIIDYNTNIIYDYEIRNHDMIGQEDYKYYTCIPYMGYEGIPQLYINNIAY